MGDNAATRLTAFVGRHSYSIYLWHIAVLEWVMPPVARPLHLGAFGRFMSSTQSLQ
jgi:peptidoglycan/LPS O-acetylase OafA/YrhL